MGKRWTDEDINELKLLARRRSAPKIAELMDRTVGGVVLKAYKLKISLRSRASEMRGERCRNHERPTWVRRRTNSRATAPWDTKVGRVCGSRRFTGLGKPDSQPRYRRSPRSHHWRASAAGLRQRGGRSSLASQPTAWVCMGSMETLILSVRSQVEHSNVRSSKPRVPGEMRAKAILCLHEGHIGRSLIRLPIPAPRTTKPHCLDLSRTQRLFQVRCRLSRERPGREPVDCRATLKCAACAAPPKPP